MSMEGFAIIAEIRRPSTLLAQAIKRDCKVRVVRYTNYTGRPARAYTYADWTALGIVRSCGAAKHHNTSNSGLVVTKSRS